ncbi:MAG: D-glycerate dehydrogenase [Caulobacter vibrioides]|uniref:D-glycerate dehydrogenase n=1 Tax=Caulobacter vibrioides TaxID=155892 RepID=A0A258DFH4_CAUVI|nr:MAG: D-glycerate dehydrogenase [Caulobacter vibrioides]
MTRILLTRRWPEAAERRMAELGEVTLNPGDQPLTAAQMRQALADYDVVCPTVTDALPAEVWPDNPRVRALCNYGVGVNHIDLAAAKARGVVVTNTPDVLTEATAEIALTLLLMVARRAGEGEREVRAGAWTGWRPTHLQGQLMTGKTVGVIGFGRIGQSFARKAHFGLGMKVIYNARNRASPEVEAETGAVYESSLDELIEVSDAVSLHCPGGAATHHLIDATRLARMKSTAILVNTARGTVVDEAALVDALKAGSIAGAGLDVFEAEPKVHPGLLDLDNAVLLPHLGSATVETRVEMGMRVAANLEAILKGEAPGDRVA